jgi:hypothetical protein
MSARASPADSNAFRRIRRVEAESGIRKGMKATWQERIEYMRRAGIPAREVLA